MGINPPKKFANLHSHSHSSSFDGLGLPEEHIDFVLENGMDALAFTEHGNCNSFAQAYLKAKDLEKKGRNLKLIGGVESYYHPSLDQWRKDKFQHEEKRRVEKERQKEEKKKSAEQIREEIEADDGDGSTSENEEETKSTAKWRNPVNRRHHLVLLAKSNKGLENLFKLVSRSNIEGMYRFPRIDAKMLKEHGEDIVATTACIGGPAAYAVFDKFQGVPFDELKHGLLDVPSKMDSVVSEIGNHLDPIIDALGEENVFTEIQFNKLEAQHLVNRALIEFNRRNPGVKLSSAADSHYCRPELWMEREIYKKLGRIRFEDIDASLLPTSKDQLKCELYPKNAEQMWNSYKEYTNGMSFYDDVLVRDAIERTYDIAHDLIGNISMDTSIKLPSFVIPPGDEDPSFRAFKALYEACVEGMEQKGLMGKAEYKKRLKYELEIIQQKNFAQYFLLTKMIMNIAYDNMLVGAGRGSGAGSLVNYVLGITQIDPLRYGLMFERFISPARNDTPDIDNDVSDRDRLLDLLRDKAGKDNVVPISNFMTLQLKSLVKDLSKLHKIDFDEVNAVTKDLLEEVMPKANDGENKSLFSLKYDDCMEHSTVFADFMEKYPQVAAPIKVLYKQNRAIGKHAGGVVICEDLDKKMPLIVVKGETRTPWPEGMNMHCLEPLGFVKSDILGIGTLRMIENCISLILRRHHDVQNPTWHDVKEWYEANLHPAALGEMDDQKVYDHVFEKMRFADIFQYTAKLTQKYIHDFAPRSVRDLSMATAIYRPGPLAAKVDKLIIKARKEGIIKKYDHPVIDTLLEESSGYCVYQEQILQLANQLAGMSHGDCDKLRKALLKRSVDKIDAKAAEAIELGKQFVDGSVANGFPEEKAKQLFDDIAQFAKYAFNYSHSLSYSVLSYQCAWLMTYFESEWLCVYLQQHSAEEEDKRLAQSEVRKLGYVIGEIDINHSGMDWSVSEDGKTFYPSFKSLKGIGDSAVEEVIALRNKQPYEEVHDLFWTKTGEWKHSKFNKRAFDALDWMDGFNSMKLPFDNDEHRRHVIIDCAEEFKKPKRNRPKTAGLGEFIMRDDGFSGELVRKEKNMFIISDGTFEREILAKSVLDHHRQFPKKFTNRIDEGECKPNLFLEPKDRLDDYIERTKGYFKGWDPQVKAEHQRELAGSVSPLSLLSDDAKKFFEINGIESVDTVAVNAKRKAWFVVTKGRMMFTKKANKPYILLDVTGENGTQSRMFCWNLIYPEQIPKANAVYVSLVERTDFGLTLKKDLFNINELIAKEKESAA